MMSFKRRRCDAKAIWRGDGMARRRFVKEETVCERGDGMERRKMELTARGKRNKLEHGERRTPPTNPSPSKPPCHSP
jgi:hypothetical protein